MPSEFLLDLVFIRPAAEDADAWEQVIGAEMKALFANRAQWYIDRRTNNGLDVAVVELNGLSHWNAAEEAAAYMEERMVSDCWDWLQGYRLQVIPKEDAGPCLLNHSSGCPEDKGRKPDAVGASSAAV